MEKYNMKNLTERTVTIIDPGTHAVVRAYPSEGVRVTVHRGSLIPTESVDGGVPVVLASAPRSIEGLEGVEGDIIVPLAVAEGMRALRIKHKGAVYTPQQLVFAPGPERVALGAPGLMWHADLSA